MAKKYDLVTDEGLLIKGIIENVHPIEVAERLRAEYDVPPAMMAPDVARRRLEIAPWILEELYPELA